MTTTEAKRVLERHARLQPLEHDDARGSFLAMLRPFRGVLIEAYYHEVMAALRTLADELRQDRLDRAPVAALWTICHLARSWALEPEGALQRDGRITPAQSEQLADWIDTISYATMNLLEGQDDEIAFEFYDRG